LDLAPSGHKLHARIAVDLAEELIEEARLARVDELLNDAEQDPDLAGEAAFVRFKWLFMSRPEEATRTIAARLPDMLERLTLAGDERGLAKAHLIAYTIHWLGSRAEPATAEAR